MSIKSLRDSFGEALVTEGEINKNIVAVSCDLKNACKLDKFFKTFPKRSFEVGIAEANGIGIATGLALSGFRPFIASFGSFIMGKNIEIRTSISYNLAPVVVVGTHGGLIGADGATQAALQDIGVMRSIPDFEVFQPCSEVDVKELMRYVVNSHKPTYLRIGRNEIEEFLDKNHKFSLGKPNLIKKGLKKMVISSGPMVINCLKAIQAIENNDDFGLLNITSLKPLNEKLLLDYLVDYETIITVEDHLIQCGLGTIISEIFSRNSFYKPIKMHGLSNEFIESDTPSKLEKHYQLDVEGIKNIIINT
tara:strand:+ start:1345 stop:2262 length:918 start_codon:yes stop_codon:yes gene_type:complete